MTIEVLAAGALTTVQDLGRRGLGAQGVPRSGAFDRSAARIANRLVGNDDAAAGLEMTMVGATLRFGADALVALAGSRFDATLDDEPAAWWRAHAVRAGSTLAIGRTGEGARCFLAVAGGIDVEPVLGARASHVAARLGPAPLAAGDVVPTGPRTTALLRRFVAPPPYEPDRRVRVTVGPHAETFEVEALLAQPYRVSPRSDRTGVRLDGRPMTRASTDEILPEPTVEGAVQVPHDGQPIILGPDRPVTGGYPQIAVVIRADLDHVANAKPGDTLRFVAVTRDEARAARQERERWLREGFEAL